MASCCLMSEDGNVRASCALDCFSCDSWCCDPQERPEARSTAQSSYTWNPPDATSLMQTAYAASSSFACGDQIWKLHVHVFQVRQCGVARSYLAVYVEWRPLNEAAPDHLVQFKLTLKNCKNERLVYKQRCSHRFVCDPHSGFTLFVPTERILDPTANWTPDYGFAVTFRLHSGQEHCSTKPSLQFGTYGFSVLSIFAVAVRYLYHIRHFRRVVEKVHIRQGGNEDGIKLMCALKKIFRDMTIGASDHIDLLILFKAYGSQLKDLGKVFEFWEFFQYFTWRLASCWKDLEDSPFHLLFVGNYVHSFKSISAAHVREFEVLQLDTMDTDGFYEALNNSCSLEDGQPIKSSLHAPTVQRSTQFSQFPPVLRLILKRFKYDAFQRKNMKLLQFFDFPIHLKIDHTSFRYLAVRSSGLKEHNYKLTSVIAHEGSSMKTGYYVMYVRTNEDQWMKLSDSTSIMTEDQVMESCARSACFLSYVRMSDWDWVMT